MAKDPRLGFLETLLGDRPGYLAAPFRKSSDKTWTEKFYEWPAKAEDFLEFVDKKKMFGDVYFCPTILSFPDRNKENIPTSSCLWADLDTCEPELLRVEPSIVIQSSPGRYQAYWLLDAPVPATDAEYANKRIAYYHANDGCDTSGWDLTQVLRFPTSTNHKYLPEMFEVKVIFVDGYKTYKLSDFQVYPDVDYNKPGDQVMPSQDELPKETAEEILNAVRYKIHPQAEKLFREVPRNGSWSELLWQLELLLFNVGLTPEEVFVVCKEAACNKYKRDGRSDDYLWRDVCRAKAAFEGPAHAPKEITSKEVDQALAPLELLSQGERQWVESSPTIIEDYVEWGKSVGDAAWQYHEAGAFILLSTLLAGTVRLPTSFGIVIPNIWFMILADTTLTRKSTAMDMAMDILVDVDSDSVLATDGSVEGILTALSMRPGRPSVFLRDEFSGMLEAMTKKDYMAGMLETLTKLYDGKYQKKILRRETIELKDPVFIMFTGGIRTKILSLLTNEHVYSGFLPRFLFVTAETDLARLKPIGPPTVRSLEGRDALVRHLRDIWSHYQVSAEKPKPGEMVIPKVWDAELTPDAWRRYNVLESKMQDAGVNSPIPDILVPTLDRLCKSGLKMAVLIAASSRLANKIVVEETDLIRAFSYIEKFMLHTVQVVANVGKGVDERLMERIHQGIIRRPQSSRSDIMRSYSLTSRQADQIFRTMEERELIRPVKASRGSVRYEAVQSKPQKEVVKS